MRYGGGCGNTIQDVHSIVDLFLVFARVVGSGFRVLFFKLKTLWLWCHPKKRETVGPMRVGCQPAMESNTDPDGPAEF
jgi:hypothetical protein